MDYVEFAEKIRECRKDFFFDEEMMTLQQMTGLISMMKLNYADGIFGRMEAFLLGCEVGRRIAPDRLELE